MTTSHSQQDLVRALLIARAWTRQQLADVLLVTRRRIDSWLLPSTSRQGRKMEASDRSQLESMLREANLRRAAQEDGRRDVSDLAPPGLDLVRCESADVTFPPLYRAVAAKLDEAALAEHREVRWLPGVGVAYGFDPDGFGWERPDVEPPRVEAIAALDATLDPDGVAIVHLRNEGEALAFLTAVSLLAGEDLDPELCDFNGQTFGLLRIPPRGGRTPGQLVYRSSFHREDPRWGHMLVVWEMKVLPDGTATISEG